MIQGKSTSQALMTDTMRVFLQTKVDSFVKWDLLRFFHDNPHARDTAENIARYMGRDVRTFERELDELVQSGVLQVQDMSGLVIYALVDDDTIRSMVHQFMEACHDRRFRVEAIHYVIRAMQDSASQREY